MNARIIPLAAVAALALASCGQTPRGNSSWSAPDAPWVVALEQAEQAAHTGATGRTPGKGVGPVDHVDVASLDESLKAKGEEIFNGKCSACHKLNERYIGPALSGVTKRREPEWILNMILNPDKMVREDPVAKSLLGEYIAPMTNFNLSMEEAEGVLVFFLDNDKGLQEAEPAASTADTGDEPAQPQTTINEGH